ncbi:T-cell surface protein tactile [Candoia aspera]|uniref:T-cell surface protein tactile n=1 Tax=Candoia aspera TaxID=51853 RepID=UPI002FD81CE3
MGLQGSYLLILACILSGGSAVKIMSEETVYASTGSNVTLKCSIFQGKETHVTQIQWSKFVDGLNRIIAVYNPRYGTKYFDVAYNNSASFEKGFHDGWTDFSRTSKEVNSIANNLECNQWVLQLKNVTLELSGSYECIFTTFPIGTSSSKIHLIVKKRDYKLHALLNQTLEIPCLSITPHHINLANASITWLLQKENGSEEILIRKQSYYLQDYTTYLTVYKDRIQMSSKNALLISPVTVIDDGKKFVCSIANVPGRIQESAIQVKVFEKPEISLVLHTDSIGKANFTCVIKKAYPEPKLMWYMGEEILDEKSEGFLIENKGIKRIGSFYERTSFLSIWNTTPSSINQAFKCMSVYHFTRSERWNTSSKEIIIPHEFQATLLAYSEFINHVTAIPYSPTERLQTTLSEVLEVPLASDFPSESNLSTRRVTELTTQSTPTNPYTVKDGLNTGSLSTRRVTELTTQSTPTNPYTVKDGLNTGSTIVPKHSTFPWPAVVALLLLFCTFLIICGIRKWCQHQRKIMNKPPSFKPPPPPVKYTSIQVYNKIYASCDELENMV